MWPPSVEDEKVQRTDVLKIPGNRSNINAYILKLVDVVFGRDGLERIETKQVSSHDGYLFIKGEFYLSHESIQCFIIASEFVLLFRGYASQVQNIKRRIRRILAVRSRSHYAEATKSASIVEDSYWKESNGIHVWCRCQLGCACISDNSIFNAFLSLTMSSLSFVFHVTFFHLTLSDFSSLVQWAMISATIVFLLFFISCIMSQRSLFVTCLFHLYYFLFMLLFFMEIAWSIFLVTCLFERKVNQ